MLDQNTSARVHWREKPFHTLQAAGEIICVSTPTLYKMAEEGLLTFKRLRRRTMVQTDSIIAFLDSAEPWTPSASPNPLVSGKDRAV